MSEIKYFRIKSWEKYHHPDTRRYDGPLKWIRIDTAILDDEKLHKLDTNSQLTWFKLLLFSGRTRNKLEHNSIYLKHKLCLKRKPNLALFEELGLIEPWTASAEQAQSKPTLHDNTVHDSTIKSGKKKFTHPAQNFHDIYTKPKPKTFDEMRFEKNMEVAKKMMESTDEPKK